MFLSLHDGLLSDGCFKVVFFVIISTCAYSVSFCIVFSNVL